MSQFSAVARSYPLAFEERKKAIKDKSVASGMMGRVTLSFLVVAAICASGVFYIFEVNNVATQGYQIRELEKEAQELRDSNEKLKIKEAELRSMYNIEEKTKNFDMTAPKDVSYLTFPGNVAMK